MKRSLVRVGVLAENTFREAVRNKLLYNLLLFAILMIVSSIVLADLHLGYRVRIFRDVGLAAIALFGALIAIFVGINLVYREIAQRTVFIMLAKPVRRWEFLVGKYAGLLAVLLFEIVVMASSFLLVLYVQESPVTKELLYAISLIFVELALLTAIALFFSSFTTPYLAGMFTVALWVIGHLLADIRAFGDRSEVGFIQGLTEFLYWSLPNLDRLDLKAEAAGEHTIKAVRVGLAALYGALYSVGLLAVSALLFRRRDFR
jgi:ABC-type transport system involved in multi-copper enzyme maturation permease subunit